MTDFHVDVVALIFGVILFIAWLVWLEFKSSQNEKDIDNHKVHTATVVDTVWKKHDDLSGELRKEISEMNKALARIEGKLSVESKS